MNHDRKTKKQKREETNINLFYFLNIRGVGESIFYFIGLEYTVKLRQISKPFLKLIEEKFPELPFSITQAAKFSSSSHASSPLLLQEIYPLAFDTPKEWIRSKRIFNRILKQECVKHLVLEKTGNDLCSKKVWFYLDGKEYPAIHCHKYYSEKTEIDIAKHSCFRSLRFSPAPFYLQTNFNANSLSVTIYTKPINGISYWRNFFLKGIEKDFSPCYIESHWILPVTILKDNLVCLCFFILDCKKIQSRKDLENINENDFFKMEYTGANEKKNPTIAKQEINHLVKSIKCKGELWYKYGYFVINAIVNSNNKSFIHLYEIEKYKKCTRIFDFTFKMIFGNPTIIEMVEIEEAIFDWQIETIITTISKGKIDSVNLKSLGDYYDFPPRLFQKENQISLSFGNESSLIFEKESWDKILKGEIVNPDFTLPRGFIILSVFPIVVYQDCRNSEISELHELKFSKEIITNEEELNNLFFIAKGHFMGLFSFGVILSFNYEYGVLTFSQNYLDKTLDKTPSDSIEKNQ